MTASQASARKTFSIVMATYNCGAKVENTLRSIFEQNRDLFEVIVFDGASTDDTLEHLKKYANDLTLISEKDRGVYDAFNKAIDLASGKYLYFIGAGDCLRPGILDRINEILPQDAANFVYGNCLLMKQNVVWRGREFSPDSFYNENITQQAIFYHRSIFGLLGKFNVEYKICADWYYNVECFARPDIRKIYVPHIIADYEEGGLSSVLENDPAFIKDFPRLVRRRLGMKAYLRRKAFVASPELFARSHEMYYRLLGTLVTVARPFVRAVRSLKNAAGNKA